MEGGNSYDPHLLPFKEVHKHIPVSDRYTSGGIISTKLGLFCPKYQIHEVIWEWGGAPAKHVGEGWFKCCCQGQTVQQRSPSVAFGGANAIMLVECLRLPDLST